MISPRTKSLFAIFLVSMVVFAVVIQTVQATPTRSDNDESEEKKQIFVSHIRQHNSIIFFLANQQSSTNNNNKNYIEYL